MTMTPQEVQQHFMAYLEATECTVIEKSPEHVTVKLSPQADKMLTNRPYYWGFVERTGAPAETLSFNFVFDPEKYDERLAKARKPKPKRSLPRLRRIRSWPAFTGMLRFCPSSVPAAFSGRTLATAAAGWPKFGMLPEEGKCVYLFQQRDTEPRPEPVPRRMSSGWASASR